MGNEVLKNGVWGFSPDRDNAKSVAMLFGATGQTQRITGVMADYSATVAAIQTVSLFKSTSTTDTGPVTTPTLARGSTDTAVASIAFQYAIAKTMYQKAAVAAGTALAAGTIPTNKWGIYLFSINAAGTIVSTAGAANFTTGYATEAAAIAALPATPGTTSPASSASMGYVTVQTKVGSPFIGGTDSLAGGAAGNIANATNYTNTTALAPTTVLLPAHRWNFTNGPFYWNYPTIVRGDPGGAVSAELQASGTGGTTGRIILLGYAD